MKQDAQHYVGALTLSICLHVALVALLPRFPASPAVQPLTMEVEFASMVEEAPQAPQPETVPAEPMVQPQTSKPIRPQKITPQLKTAVAPSPVLAADAANNEYIAQATPDLGKQAQAEEPEKIAAVPSPASEAPSPPAHSTSASQSHTKADVPEEAGQAEAWNGYGQILHDLVGQNKQYPQIAIRRNWQGTVTVSARISQGRLVEISLIDSSGHEVLDQQALKMVRKAAEELPLPPNLARKSFTVLVPVDFRLEG